MSASVSWRRVGHTLICSLICPLLLSSVVFTCDLASHLVAQVPSLLQGLQRFFMTPRMNHSSSTWQMRPPLSGGPCLPPSLLSALCFQNPGPHLARPRFHPLAKPLLTPSSQPFPSLLCLQDPPSLGSLPSYPGYHTAPASISSHTFVRPL